MFAFLRSFHFFFFRSVALASDVGTPQPPDFLVPRVFLRAAKVTELEHFVGISLLLLCPVETPEEFLSSGNALVTGVLSQMR